MKPCVSSERYREFSTFIANSCDNEDRGDDRYAEMCFCVGSFFGAQKLINLFPIFSDQLFTDPHAGSFHYFGMSYQHLQLAA